LFTGEEILLDRPKDLTSHLWSSVCHKENSETTISSFEQKSMWKKKKNNKLGLKLSLIGRPFSPTSCLIVSLSHRRWICGFSSWRFSHWVEYWATFFLVFFLKKKGQNYSRGVILWSKQWLMWPPVPWSTFWKEGKLV
jgi:hypothetical protein